MPEHGSHLVILGGGPAYPGRVGEHNLSVVLRAGGAVVVSAVAAIALASCSLIQIAPSPVVTSSPDATSVLDPSVPSEAPTPSSTLTPVPIPTWSPEPTPTLTTLPGSTKKAVTPFVTLAAWDQDAAELQVGAIVPNLVESGGTCTVTVSKGATTRTASAPAAGVSSYTGCNPMTIPGSALSAGTWTVQVTYTSRTATGTSAAKTVAVAP
jgi:hypothetical protein